jgi:hypothetical protein
MTDVLNSLEFDILLHDYADTDGSTDGPECDALKAYIREHFTPKAKEEPEMAAEIKREVYDGAGRTCYVTYGPDDNGNVALRLPRFIFDLTAIPRLIEALTAVHAEATARIRVEEEPK